MSSHAATASKMGPKHSSEQWEAQKPNIERLYIAERKSLTDVISILARDFSFIASKKQLKSRLPKWGMDIKNLRGDTMIRLARTKAARKKFENKDTSFRVNKKTVRNENIDRYLQRHNISEEKLLAMASPVDAPSPAFSIFTPQNINSPSPRIDVNAHSSHSTAHDRVFHSPPMAEAELGAGMSNYCSPTVENVLDEDLEPTFSFRQAQAGQQDLPLTNEQTQRNPSLFETPALYNLEARTPHPYTYSPCQFSKKTLPKANNPERRFILLPSKSANHHSTKLRSPFLRNNGELGGSRKKRTAWQAKITLLHRELTS